jgi:hypothetical protein
VGSGELNLESIKSILMGSKGVPLLDIEETELRAMNVELALDL